MIFDLELKYKDPNVVFLEEGTIIPSNINPLYYVSKKSERYVPSDIIDIEGYNNSIIAYSNLPVDQVEFINRYAGGYSFYVKSDKFLLTDVVKYSYRFNIRVPMFYKSVFVLDMQDILNRSTIKLFDTLNNPIDPELYYIKTENNTITIYSNLIDEVILVEYTYNNNIKKELLKLTPVYTEVDWAFIASPDRQMPDYTYMQNEGIAVTKYDNHLYILYQYELGLIKPPVANLTDEWYLLIENHNLTLPDSTGAYNINYSVPEYYMQRFHQSIGKKEYLDISCKVLDNGYIQTQLPVPKEYINAVRIHVIDIDNKTIKRAYTTNKTDYYFNYDETSNITYQPIEDYNYNGIFKLSEAILPDEEVIASFNVKDNYYIFRSANLNTDDVLSHETVAIYITPYQNMLTKSIYYALIGKHDSRPNITKIKNDASGFTNIADYMQALAETDSYHLGYVRINKVKLANMIQLEDITITERDYIDIKQSSEINQDIFLKDYLDGTITLPLGDTVIVDISDKILDKNNRNTKTQKQSYVNHIQDVLDKNLAIHTRSIISQEEVIAVITNPPSETNNTTTDYSFTVSGLYITQYKYKLDNSTWSNAIDVNSTLDITMTTGVHTLYIIGKGRNDHWQETDMASTYTWEILSIL